MIVKSTKFSKQKVMLQLNSQITFNLRLIYLVSFLSLFRKENIIYYGEKSFLTVKCEHIYAIVIILVFLKYDGFDSYNRVILYTFYFSYNSRHFF